MSIDVTLCPFGNGIITVRTNITDQSHDLSDILNFIHYFRVLEAKLREEKGASHHFHLVIVLLRVNYYLSILYLI